MTRCCRIDGHYVTSSARDCPSSHIRGRPGSKSDGVRNRLCAGDDVKSVAASESQRRCSRGSTNLKVVVGLAASSKRPCRCRRIGQGNLGRVGINGQVCSRSGIPDSARGDQRPRSRPHRNGADVAIARCEQAGADVEVVGVERPGGDRQRAG